MNNEKRCMMLNAGRVLKQKLVDHNRRPEHGMVSVEWALTAPLFILLALMCIGVVVYTNNLSLTTNAAREAARSYSLEQNENTATNVALNVAGHSAHVEIHEDGEFVEVTVKKPPVDSLDFLGFTIQSTHIALIEPGAGL